MPNAAESDNLLLEISSDESDSENSGIGDTESMPDAMIDFSRIGLARESIRISSAVAYAAASETVASVKEKAIETIERIQDYIAPSKEEYARKLAFAQLSMQEMANTAADHAVATKQHVSGIFEMAKTKVTGLLTSVGFYSAPESSSLQTSQKASVEAGDSHSHLHSNR